MSHNLKYQFKTAIDSSFKEGIDKHAYKRGNGFQMNEKIFSYASRKDLIQTSANFAGWIKLHYPEIKKVNQIISQYVNEYLQDKNDTCSSISTAQYANRLKKLNYIINSKYYLSIEWDIKSFNKPNQKLRNIVFKREHLDLIIENKGMSMSRTALDLCSRFGLRVEESVTLKGKDVDLTNLILIVKGKGGRSRELKIEDKDIRVLMEYIEGVMPNQRIVNIRPDTVNTYLSRCCDEFDINDYKGYKSGVHSIRKLVAQEQYDMCRNAGMNIEESLSHVNRYLGHGNDRKDLNDVYVANQW